MSNDTTNPTTTNPTTTGTVPPRPITWFEIHTADPERAKTFYASVFGWSFDDAMPGYSFVDVGGGAPIRGGIATTDGTPPASLFNIQVPDVAASLDAVVANGGSAVSEVQAMPNGLTFAYAANPDGSVFGLWCPPAE